MVPSLAGHGDETHRCQDLSHVTGLSPGDPHELLVIAADGERAQPPADLELLEQGLRNILRRCGGQDDRVERCPLGPAVIAVADPGADVAIARVAQLAVRPGVRGRGRPRWC